MKFYLSSYKLGTEIGKLKLMLPDNKKTAYISNALDFSNDPERRKQSEESDIEQLKQLGLKPEPLDLRDYFGKKEELKNKLNEFGIIWVRGGNCFVLRRAMKLSGLDSILKDLAGQNINILYGGYSAGTCILGQTLEGLNFVDDPDVNPYDNKEPIWDGIGILDYTIVPHYKSDHPESKKIDEALEHMGKNKIPFKALRDGEVIIIE